MEEEKTKLANAERRARRLALPRQKRYGTDMLRSGRLGDDFSSDEMVLIVDRYNKHRLTMRLFALMNEHRWDEAAGVASILVRSLAWWREVDAKNRPIFSAAMEILRQIQSGEDLRNKLRKLFNLMYSSQPSCKSMVAKKLKGDVQLELALYLSSTGDQEGAYNALRPIIDAAPLRDDAAVNLAYGLILHQMWFDLVSEGLSAENGEGSYSGEWQPKEETNKDANYNPATGNVPPSVRDAGEASDSGDNSELLDITMGNTVKLNPSRKRKRRPQATDDDEFWQNARVCIQPDMDWRLFPVRLPYEQPNVEYLVPFTDRAKEVCVDSVRHLQLAVSSAPEMTHALVPLVQLLLSLGEVEAANKELDICYQATKSIVPLSLRALLLESLAEKDVVRIANCFEAVLLRNPSSVDAMSSLISLHNNEEYETENLIQAIANHLDAEPGSVHVWHKLADCLLEVAMHLESGDNSDWDVRLEDVACVFVDRRAWWTSKHYSEKHTVTKDSRLLTYKAACAVHIYGPEFRFVKDVSEVLEALKLKRLLAALQSHQQHVLRLLD